jgi:hypothetical protein
VFLTYKTCRRISGEREYHSPPKGRVGRFKIYLNLKNLKIKEASKILSTIGVYFCSYLKINTVIPAQAGIHARITPAWFFRVSF